MLFYNGNVYCSIKLVVLLLRLIGDFSIYTAIECCIQCSIVFISATNKIEHLYSILVLLALCTLETLSFENIICIWKQKMYIGITHWTLET